MFNISITVFNFIYV